MNDYPNAGYLLKLETNVILSVTMQSKC